MSEHFVYKFYDVDNRPLYFGCTNNLRQRMAAHQSTSAWVDEADGMTLDKYPDRASALAAERAAIRAERPRFNRTHNPDWRIKPQAAEAVVHASLVDVRLNLVAFDHFRGDRTHAQVAASALIPLELLTQIVAGRRASMAVAKRLAGAIGCSAGTLFPELVSFTTQARVFTSTDVAA